MVTRSSLRKEEFILVTVPEGAVCMMERGTQSMEAERSHLRLQLSEIGNQKWGRRGCESQSPTPVASSGKALLHKHSVIS